MLSRMMRYSMLLFLSVALTGCYQGSVSLYPEPAGFARIDPGGEYIYTEPTLSSDGKKIAYTRYDGSGVKGYYSNTGEIFVLNLENRRMLQLTTNEAMDASPAWSPDDKQIAYHRQEYEFDEHHAISATTDTLRIMNSDGTGDRIAYVCPFECGSPSWSPDGTWIAFAGWTGPDTFDLTTEPAMHIYLIRPDGSEVIRLTNIAKHATAPRWSPDGQQIVFKNWIENQMWVVEVSTGRETRLETNRLPYVRSYSWTPDQKGIVFSAEQSDRPDQLHREPLYFLDLTSSEVKPFFKKETNFLTYAEILGSDLSSDSKTLILGLYPAIYRVDLSVAENNWR